MRWRGEYTLDMTGQEVFNIIYNGFLYLFMITTFLSMGMGYTVAQLTEPLKRYSLMTRAVILNIILIPAVAYVLTLLVPVDEVVVTGIILVAICPAAAFGPKLAQMEKGDVPYGISSMFLLAILSMVTIPISATLLLPGDFSLSPSVILRTLILFELIPLTVGLGLRARYSELAETWQPSVSQTSSISLMVVIVLMVVSQISAVISLLGSMVLLVAVLLVGSSLIMGYFIGGPATETKRVTATTGAVRNNAVALVLAAPLEPLVTVVAFVYALLAVAGGALAAGEWAKRGKDKVTAEDELNSAA